MNDTVSVALVAAATAQTLVMYDSGRSTTYIVMKPEVWHTIVEALTKLQEEGEHGTQDKAGNSASVAR